MFVRQSRQGQRDRELERARDGGGVEIRLALIKGAPEATEVQLSPLPPSAMSDQHNKPLCVILCS